MLQEVRTTVAHLMPSDDCEHNLCRLLLGYSGESRVYMMKFGLGTNEATQSHTEDHNPQTATPPNAGD